MSTKHIFFTAARSRLSVLFIISVCVVGWVSCLPLICWADEGSHPVTTVLVIRHAEKMPDAGNNPSLSDAGQARAQELVHVAGQSGIASIYSTQYLRTQQTVQPLADVLNLPVIAYAAQKPADLVAKIKAEHTGEVVLVVGHSNTVPGLIELFGGGTRNDLDSQDYDNLYLLTVCQGVKTTVVQLQYGE